MGLVSYNFKNENFPTIKQCSYGVPSLEKEKHAAAISLDSSRFITQNNDVSRLGLLDNERNITELTPVRNNTKTIVTEAEIEQWRPIMETQKGQFQLLSKDA